MRCTWFPCTTTRRRTTPTVLFKRPVETMTIPSHCSVCCVCALFCSVPKVFFPRWAKFYSYFCAPRILPRMHNTPRGSPAIPATEDNLAQTPSTGATPPTHVGARTPAATGPSLPFRAPNTRRRSCQRRRQSRHTWTSPLPARPPVNAEPPPATPAQAATHQHPCPPGTPAAGLANAGGGAGTLGRRPCPPPYLQAEPPPAIPAQSATKQHPFPPDTPAASLVNAGGGAGTRGRPPCPPPPQCAEPSPEIPTPAAIRPFPCPPHTCAAGLANASGRAVT